MRLQRIVDTTGELNGFFRSLFRSVSAALATVSMFYCGYPILKQAALHVKRLQLTIDMPLSLGLLCGYFYSAFGYLTGSERLFFDTVSMIVCLILVSRFAQERMIRYVQRRYVVSDLSGLSLVRLQNIDGREMFVDMGQLKAGDTFVTLPGDLIVVNARSRHAHGARVTYESITGEPQEFLVEEGECVRAGAACVHERAEWLALEKWSGLDY